MTRAVGLLAHGHAIEATRINPAVWVLALLLAWPRLPSFAVGRLTTSGELLRPMLRG